jgi:hypothetical protein
VYVAAVMPVGNVVVTSTGALSDPPGDDTLGVTV